MDLKEAIKKVLEGYVNKCLVCHGPATWYCVRTKGIIFGETPFLCDKCKPEDIPSYRKDYNEYKKHGEEYESDALRELIKYIGD